MAQRAEDISDHRYKVASSHLITTCATLAALILFVILGAEVMPSAIGNSVRNPAMNALVAAFLLNIAIVLFGWRRAKELAESLAALQQAEIEAHSNAYTDHLTGLANRRALMRELEALPAGQPGTSVLLVIDLDHFKRVNDIHGHPCGDELLQLTGRILVEEVGNSGLAARLGGDEFAVLLDKAERAEPLAQNILKAFATPLEFGGCTAQISMSIGIAPMGPKGTPSDMLRTADVAMYSVKRSGRNGYAWFDEQMELQLKSRAALEDEIRLALESDEFVPFFQPLISLDTGDLNGFEVLARWKSPTRGIIEPEAFIGIAEQSGLIGALSLRVMHKAFVEAKSWPAHIKLAVNISPVQFRDPQLAERIVKVMTETGFPPRRLEVEITESSLMEDRAQALATVQSLRNIGVAIALDDFGTGYASLGRLHDLPFDRIKIDRTFINALDTNEQSAAIVETIAALGRSMGVQITAEGVESDAVRQRLIELGCPDAQGWHFGRAVSGHVAGMQATSSEPPSSPLRSKSEPLPPLQGQSKAGAGRKW